MVEGEPAALFTYIKAETDAPKSAEATHRIESNYVDFDWVRVSPPR